MTRRVLVLLLAFAGCAPDFDLRTSLVDRERVIAVVAEPAEARPGEPVSYAIAAAGPGGPIDEPALFAAYCTVPKSLDENNSVADACTADPGILLETQSGVARGAIPAEACRLYGPDPPPGGFRPRDPDASGGYYQPLRVAAFGQELVHLQRVLCNPGDVAADVAREFFERYRPNQNPGPIRLEVLDRGTSVELRLEWPDSARETYPFVDRARQVVIERREGLRVDWFATTDGLALDRHVVDERDPVTSVLNEFGASGTTAHVWAVVHDSRGGSAVVEQRLDLSRGVR